MHFVKNNSSNNKNPQSNNVFCKLFNCDVKLMLLNHLPYLVCFASMEYVILCTYSIVSNVRLIL